MAQNECEISQNLNKINDDDANKKLQHNWCPGNQTKCRGETVAVSGCDQIFMEDKAESALPIIDPWIHFLTRIVYLSHPILDINRVAGMPSLVSKF